MPSQSNVVIQTSPHGAARVVFYPLDSIDGRFGIEQMVVGEGAELVQAKLRPGEYLVVTAAAQRQFS